MVGSQPLSQAFHPTSFPMAASTVEDGAAAPAVEGSWLPSEETPNDCELKPWAWAPTTFLKVPPERPSNSRPNRSTKKL